MPALFRNSLVFIFLLNSIFITSCSKDDDDDLPEPGPETGAIMDIEGNVYITVKIGDQWWMAENLRTGTYRDGTAIPNLQDDTEWLSAGVGAWVHYENDNSLAGIFGNLYNWHAVADARGLCPDGWRVPSDADWRAMEMHLGMTGETSLLLGHRGTEEGGMLKEEGVHYWNIPNAGATNVTGFTALPAGSRQVEPFVFFDFLGDDADYWASTSESGNKAFSRGLNFKTAGIFRNISDKRIGFSVRCIEELRPAIAVPGSLTEKGENITFRSI